jgi:hypothetical protein
MVGFRKEINREENLEIIPIGRGNGAVDLAFEAWNDHELVLATWPLPPASISSGGAPTHIPEAGDVIRVRWEQVGASVSVRASYYDASAQRWHADVIDTTVPTGSLHGVDFADGFHTASSITVDSPEYGIRRFRVGALATAPCVSALAPGGATVPAAGGSGTVTVTAPAGCTWTAAAGDAWLGVVTGASGSGSGAVAWSAAANIGSSSRTATIAIGGQFFAVTQAGSGAAPGVPAIGIGDASVVESGAGAEAAVFPVTLSAPSGQVVSVAYATSDGSAQAGSDYLAASGVVTFPPGATSATITVLVVGDAVDEPAETFTVALSAPVNATIGDGSAVGTIVPAHAATVHPPAALVAGPVAGASVTLRWDPPALGPAPTGYVLTGGVAPGQALATIVLGAEPRLFTVALPPGQYFVRLQALAGEVASQPTPDLHVSVQAPVPPSPPSGLVGTVADRTITLAWRSTFAGGEPASARLEVSGAVTLTQPLGPVQTFSVAGVPPGTYTFAVRSANAFGVSAPSNPVTLTVPTPCSGPPPPPEGFLVYRLGRTLVARWDPGSSGTAPSSFVVTATGPLSATVPTAARTVSGAVPPGTYDLRVAAVNACGTSAPTAAQTVVVP